MNILCISHGSTLNGGERAFAETLQALSSEGHCVYAIFPSEGHIIDKCKRYIKHYEIIFQPWWLDRGAKLSFRRRIGLFLSFVESIKKTCCFIKDCKPDLIISNTSAIYTGAFSAKRMGIKHIWYLHESVGANFGYKFIYGNRLSLWLIDRLSFAVFFNSHFLALRYKNDIREEKRHVLYQPVDVDTYFYPDKILVSDRLTAILVGRFEREKGQLEALEAIRLLKERNEAINLLLVGAGDDDYSRQVKAYISDNGLEELVQTVDFTDNVGTYYKQADFALICSKCEAFGRVTVESMKMGLPVIASNTGANPELIRNEFNGFLYEYGNVEDLSEKILYMRNMHKREVLAKQAQGWANETFNANNYAMQLCTIVNDL
jgi:glycosyltransferase involved in cell wall biosynthesis